MFGRSLWIRWRFPGKPISKLESCFNTLLAVYPKILTFGCWSAIQLFSRDPRSWMLQRPVWSGWSSNKLSLGHAVQRNKEFVMHELSPAWCMLQNMRAKGGFPNDICWVSDQVPSLRCSKLATQCHKAVLRTKLCFKQHGVVSCNHFPAWCHLPKWPFALRKKGPLLRTDRENQRKTTASFGDF